MARALNPEILSLLKNKTGKAEKTIRNEISLLRRTVSGAPINSVAQIYAVQHGTSVIMKLTPEERKAVPNLIIEKSITVRQKQPNTHKKRSLKQFIKYDTSDIFLRGHVEEVNRCYTFGCYTAAYILCRKIIENLIVDIIRKKYDQRKLEDINIHFDTFKGRTRDFSKIISNLRPRAKDFGPDKKLMERILTKSSRFKDDANDKAHSLYHLVKRSELEGTDVPEIVEMLWKLRSNLNSTK